MRSVLSKNIPKITDALVIFLQFFIKKKGNIYLFWFKNALIVGVAVDKKNSRIWLKYEPPYRPHEGPFKTSVCIPFLWIKCRFFVWTLLLAFTVFSEGVLKIF